MPQRPGRSETQCFVNSLKDFVHECCRQGPPWYVVPKDDLECLQLTIIFAKALCQLMDDMHKHTNNVCPCLLIGIELLHVWAVKEVFGGGEYQVCSCLGAGLLKHPSVMYSH